MKWASHVAHIGNMRSVMKIFVRLWKRMLNTYVLRILAGFNRLIVLSSLCALLSSVMDHRVPIKTSWGSNHHPIVLIAFSWFTHHQKWNTLNEKVAFVPCLMFSHSFWDQPTCRPARSMKVNSVINSIQIAYIKCKFSSPCSYIDFFGFLDQNKLGYKTVLSCLNPYMPSDF